MISQTDIIIYEALKLGLQDVKENIWLIDDIFSVLKNPNFVASQNGQAEIDAIKNWFQNTDIPVLLKYRVDKETFPCVTVALGSSQEKSEMKHLADLSTDVEVFTPSQTQKPISFIVKRFLPESVNTEQSYIVVRDDFSFRGVRVGQTLVDLTTGLSVRIIRIDKNKIYYEPDDRLELLELAIAPEFPYYKARREHTFFQETVSIGCHVSGDPIQAIWLSSIVIYVILRYRESLLEAKYYTQSQIGISELVPNEEYGGVASDLVYSRYITMSGQVEYSWIKGLKRVVEKVELENFRSDDDIGTGVRFLSNENSVFSDDIETVSWTTVKDSQDDEDL